MAQVAVAAGRDDTLPALTAIRAEIDGPQLTLVATDRYRLAIRHLTWRPAGEGIEGAFLIPAHVLTDVARAAETAIYLALPADGQRDAPIAGLEAGAHRANFQTVLTPLRGIKANGPVYG